MTEAKNILDGVESSLFAGKQKLVNLNTWAQELFKMEQGELSVKKQKQTISNWWNNFK